MLFHTLSYFICGWLKHVKRQSTFVVFPHFQWGLLPNVHRIEVLVGQTDSLGKNILAFYLRKTTKGK